MKSEIIVILDRSGSMNTIKMDAIGGFNQFIEEQKKIEGEATVTLVQFDDSYEIVYENIPLNEVKPLNETTFVPRGMTALYDAIGRTINKVSERVGCPCCTKETKVIFAILTDGEENSSLSYTQKSINEKIRHQRDTHKWEFIFLAANQDAFKTGNMLGIKTSDTFNFVANPIGTQIAYLNMSNAVRSYRTNDKD